MASSINVILAKKIYDLEGLLQQLYGQLSQLDTSYRDLLKNAPRAHGRIPQRLLLSISNNAATIDNDILSMKEILDQMLVRTFMLQRQYNLRC